MIFQSDRANVPRVIVFTSATPAEGKTTVACNLAIALAEIGKKVLLIDADLRRPHLHQLFEVDNEVGLSNILQDDRLDEEKLEASIKSTGSAELFLLPSGPPIGNVGKHLFVEHLPGLFARLKQSFDVVLIDAPPILQLPDAPVLGRAADGVILVVRAGQTTRETTLAAYNSLSVHCHVLGTILNHWDPKRSQNGYSTTYFDR
jgi:capsular exopolysaccharide synthesis family protein